MEENINTIEKLLTIIHKKIYDYATNKKYQKNILFYNNIKQMILMISNTYTNKLHNTHCIQNYCICCNLIILKNAIEQNDCFCIEIIKNDMQLDEEEL